MKIQIILVLALLMSGQIFVSCEDKDYPAGLPEYDHHYYIVYVPNNNTQVIVNRNQTALLKFPVQFYSSFTRDYDAVAHYSLVNPATGDPAVVGVDFDIVNKEGNTIPSVNGKYSITFPKAMKATDTVYVKLLNNPVPGRRVIEINLEDNITDSYRVDVFSTAFRRPLAID